MRSLIFIILAGYAVKCDDANYYLIEMPEDTQADSIKPFQVYWNVPTMQCKSKKIPFENLFEKYGIIQNKDDSFRGEKVAILYDPGLFPALLKNETSGKFVFRNGGVPQEGDLEKHLAAFKSVVDQSIPDPDFSGIGIIDFESWRPVFRQNWGVLVPYKDVSYQIERKLHWFWTEKAIQARARQRFEDAARVFMQTTLSLAKKLRPHGRWGYYGFPYCFNMASNNMVENCSDNVKQENDRTYWLWSESTALFPSVYSSSELSSRQLAALIRGRLREAAREARGGALVLPYFWFRYREGGYLSQEDLDTALATMYNSNASGILIWGSSGDVNTVDKCNDLLEYTEEVLGPAVAKYTKVQLKNNTGNVRDTRNPTVTSNIGITTSKPFIKESTKKNNDPDYHWEPPENYTQDIVHYVEQEWIKKRNDTTKHDNEILVNIKKYTLIDYLIDMLKNNKESSNTSTNLSENPNLNDKVQTTDPPPSTLGYYSFNNQFLESSTLAVNSLSTINPIKTVSKNERKGVHAINIEIADDSDPYLGPTTLKFVKSLSTTPLYTTKGYITIIESNSEKSTTENIELTQNFKSTDTGSYKTQEYYTSERTINKQTYYDTTKNISETYVPYTLSNIVENATEIYLDEEPEKYNDTNDNLYLSTQSSLLENINVYDITTSYKSDVPYSESTKKTFKIEENTFIDKPSITTESSSEFIYEDTDAPSKNYKKHYYIENTDYETDFTSTETDSKSQTTTEAYTDLGETFDFVISHTSTEGKYNITDIALSLESNATFLQDYLTINSTETLISDEDLEENLIAAKQERIEEQSLSTKNSDSTTENLRFTKDFDDVPDSFNEENGENSVGDTSTGSPSPQVVFSV